MPAKPRAIPLASLPQETATAALRHIAENLRPDDLRELEASVGGDPVAAVALSALASTMAWVVVDRTGLPIAAFGVAPTFFPEIGTPWFVATPGLEPEALRVARGTRRYVAEMHRAYPILTNFVDVRNDLAQDWLLWAGFSFVDVTPRYGAAKVPFIQFTKAA